MAEDNTILFDPNGRVMAVLSRSEVSTRLEGDFLVVTVRQRLHLPRKKTDPPAASAPLEKQPG